MSDTVSLAEIIRQHVEVLPPRAVMSIFACRPGILGSDTNNEGDGSGGLGGSAISDSSVFLFGGGTGGADGAGTGGVGAGL